MNLSLIVAIGMGTPGAILFLGLVIQSLLELFGVVDGVAK